MKGILSYMLVSFVIGLLVVLFSPYAWALIGFSHDSALQLGMWGAGFVDGVLFCAWHYEQRENNEGAAGR